MADKVDETTQEMRVDDKDWFLQILVDLANGGCSFGITLNVGGFLVSGYLVGGKPYFEGFAEEFAGIFQDIETADSIKSKIAQNGEMYTSEEEIPPPTYIHIQDAHFFNTNGNPIPGNRGVWWRGRLSQVDGFSLGSLSVSTS